MVDNSQQTDIFDQDRQQLHFAELCNALYERELLTLSQQRNLQPSLLQRRLAGLSHHIKRAADHLLNNQAPIEIDVHNGSWQAKQAAKCMAAKADADKTATWFSRHAKAGIPVPVYVMHQGMEHIELDSVDRIDSLKKLLHTNKHGWFNFDGSTTYQSSQQLDQKQLLQPAKATMTAACCGHVWNHKGRTQPRALTLRELLLSTTINWKTFR